MTRMRQPAVALRSLLDGTYTIVDTATAGQAKVQLASNIGANSMALLNGGALVIDVDYATVGALATVTYANGTSGVGATLTASANGAMAAVDGQTPAAGDVLLVGHQAAPLQNGIYTVTSAGDGSNPFVLTRLTQVDTAAELATSVIVVVAKGIRNNGKVWRFRGDTWTIGTSGLNRLGVTTIGDIRHGPGRDRLIVDEDFANFDTVTVASTGLRIASGCEWIAYFSGTGTGVITQQEGTDLVHGSAELPTGSTTTGRTALAFSQGVAFDATKYWYSYIRFKTPTASDGTNTFGIKAGWMDTTDLAPANGVYVQGRSATNYEVVCRSGGTETVVDTGVAPATTFRPFEIIAPGDGKVYFYHNGSEVSGGGISTNIPSAAIFPCVGILKSAGGTSRVIRVDQYGVDQPNTRTAFFTP